MRSNIINIRLTIKFDQGVMIRQIKETITSCNVAWDRPCDLTVGELASEVLVHAQHYLGEHCTVETCHLKLGETILQNDKRLSEYNINSGTEIVGVVRVPALSEAQAHATEVSQSVSGVRSSVTRSITEATTYGYFWIFGNKAVANVRSDGSIEPESVPSRFEQVVENAQLLSIQVQDTVKQGLQQLLGKNQSSNDKGY